MKKNFLVFLILLLMVSFSLGMLIVSENVIPVNLKNLMGKNTVTTYSYFQNDISALIHINNHDDISKIRSSFINYIWHDSTLPNSKLPIKIEKNFFDNRFNDLENLNQIDKFTVSMEYGVNSTSYLFLPNDSNNNLIIYHQGHKGDFLYGKTTIESFLKNGYSVLAFSMPLLGMNNQPVIESDFGKIKLVSHNYFSFLESSEFSPMKFYFEPISLSLNYVENNFNFNNISMVGLSGGGWTTTVYSALDERISTSFSIAGSIPIFLRTTENNLGDYEQTLSNFYKIGNYLDLYLLASYGENRKHIQIFNENDPCCFSGDPREINDKKIKSVLKDLGNGNYDIYVDDTHFEHKISEFALNIIQNEIEKN